MTAKGKAGPVAPPTPPAPRQRRPKRPKTIEDVKAALGLVYVLLRTGELEPKRANAGVYALSTLAGVIVGHDLEQRLAQLEEERHAV